MKKDHYLVINLILLFQVVDVSLLFGQGFLINQVKTLETRNALTNKSYSDIGGSPYYTKDFIESRLLGNGGNYADLPLRYDAFQDEMEFMKDGKISWINKKEVTSVKYGKDTLLVCSLNRDSTKQGYFFIIGSGKYSLLFRKRIAYQPAVPAKGYADAVPDRFIHENDEFFIKPQKNPAVRIKNRKDLLEFFTDDKTALDFIKKERLKADNLEDLKKLVCFLNGL